MDENEFPPNKQPGKQVKPAGHNRPEEKKVVEKVISGTAKTRRKPLMRRLSETFIAEDAQSVGRYLLLEVLIPAAKDMILDLGREGLERALFGGRTSGRRSGYRPGSSGAHVNYGRYSSSGPPWARNEERPAMSQRARKRHDFDEILIDTRADANQILDSMYEFLSRYDQVTVSDLYDLAGLEPKFTDDNWGWRRLDGARAVHVRNGYILDLPPTEQLDN